MFEFIHPQAVLGMVRKLKFPVSAREEQLHLATISSTASLTCLASQIIDTSSSENQLLTPLTPHKMSINHLQRIGEIDDSIELEDATSQSRGRPRRGP